MTLDQGSEMFGCESKLRKKKLCIWQRETIRQQEKCPNSLLCKQTEPQSQDPTEPARSGGSHALSMQEEESSGYKAVSSC